MERKASHPNVVPEAALLHFAFTQRQYVAVYNAVAFFARKLVSPREKEIAISALGVLMTPTGFSLPSDTTVREAAPTAVRDAEVMIDKRGPDPAVVARTGGATPPTAATRKGLDSLLRGRKKT